MTYCSIDTAASVASSYAAYAMHTRASGLDNDEWKELFVAIRNGLWSNKEFHDAASNGQDVREIADAFIEANFDSMRESAIETAGSRWHPRYAGKE